MSDQNLQKKRGLVVRVLVALAILLLVAVFYSPTWWVALKAPQYPATSFPDGVRIHFHMNGVFNGCQLLDKKEIEEEKALDCVHEMDAINHFVGMFPIASGGVVEKAFSPFLLAFLAVMLLGFMIFNPRLRMLVMAVCFGAIAVLMYLTYYGKGGIKYQNAGYLDAMVTSLGQGQEEEGEELSPVIAKLKRSLLESGIGAQASQTELQETLTRTGQSRLGEALAKLRSGSGQSVKSLKEILAEAESSRKTGKDLNIQILQEAFNADMRRKPAAEREVWIGSTAQVFAWHYEKSLGRWFNNPELNLPMVATMTTVANILFWVIVVAMLAMIFIGRNNGKLHWLLILIPILLPVFFIIEYASWLWWYGHSLNELGAFTLKPFMPTVFGQGKVAQFSTHSYPHIGFGFMMVMSVLLLLALLIRRKHLREANSK